MLLPSTKWPPPPTSGDTLSLTPQHRAGTPPKEAVGAGLNLAAKGWKLAGDSGRSLKGRWVPRGRMGGGFSMWGDLGEGGQSPFGDFAVGALGGEDFTRARGGGFRRLVRAQRSPRKGGRFLRCGRGIRHLAITHDGDPRGCRGRGGGGGGGEGAQ
ncbi:hypothetical protein TIFTF001_029579 [Ficus carica]|uniref:Uncharacterized protein n=1 Tax=Ficus carica TaxID=3494 RepID=A0AA88DSR9_FICCA|nr:hypothetical protein TIFTF001_029579 [Ficus carica]